MKKLIAALLAFCCIFAVVSCDTTPEVDDSNENLDEEMVAQIDAVLAMFEDSIPTKSVTNTSETVGGFTIKSSAYLATGMINGKKASVYEGSYQSLSEVGNTFDMVTTETESRWYIEGEGVSTDKGVTWDSEAGDFAPKSGFIKLSVKKSQIKEAEYYTGTSTLELVVDKAYATEVVGSYLEAGQSIDSDIIITIVTAGGRVTGLKLEYTIPAHQIDVEDSEAVINVPETTIVVDAKYSYGLQNITFE